MGPRRFVAVVMLSVIAGAGCGGGGGPSRAEYLARAQRVCRLARAQTAPLVAEVAAAVPSLTAARGRRLAPAVRRLHDVESHWLGRLRALEQPSGDHHAIARFLDPAGELVGALGTAASALEHGETVTALLVLQRFQSSSRDAQAAAQDYGFTRCGSLVSVGG